MARLPLLLLSAIALLLAACSQPAAPLAALQVETVYPAADATDVAVQTAVLVTFDAQLDPDDLYKPISLKAGNDLVQGTVEYDDASNALAFIPSSELDYESEYSVVVAETVRGLNGAALGEVLSWTFTTEAPEAADDGGDPDGGKEQVGEELGDDEFPEDDNPALPPRDETEIVLPGVLSVSPKPWTWASRTTTVDVTFNKEFASGELANGVDIEVYSFLGGLLHAIWGTDFGRVSGNVTGAGDTATWTPNKTLKGGDLYWVFLDIDLEDDAGNALKGSGDWLFKTVRAR